LQNSPLENSFVTIALTENYSTSKPLKTSPENSEILSCDTLVSDIHIRQGERCLEEYYI
jgi:hypothetical protein